jgi:LuxR family maltose regulon positive regulatory protein
LSWGETTATLLSATAGLPTEKLKTSLLNELSALREEFYLFLDDYHVIDDSDIKAFIRTLLLSPLANVHLIIGTRSENDLPVSRLRALARIYEFDAKDLLFSESEISDFFSHIARVSLDEDRVKILRERTEGWIASLQMISIAVRGVDLDALLRSFSGEHRSVSDFLTDEVFKRQPPDIQEFLLASSLLERFNTGLCNAVLRRRNSREVLDRLEIANLFIFSLGTDRNWYRYHHLFSEFLRKTLADRDPDLLIEYHRRACTWLASNNLTTEAIDHAFAARDTEHAADLLDEASAALFATGQISTLQRYSAQLPADVLHRLPRLQLELAWHYEIQWKFDRARKVLSHVRRVLGDRKTHTSAASHPNHTRYLDNKLAHRELMLAMFTDDYQLALKLCKEWQRSTESDDLFMVASVGTSLMMCNRERYSCEGTERTADALRHLFVDASAYYGTIFHDSAVGETFFMRGEIDLANHYFAQALTSAEALHGEGSTLASMPATLLAAVMYERNQLSDAAALLGRYRHVTAEFGFVDGTIARFIIDARLSRANGNREAAAAALDAGLEIGRIYHFNRLQAHLLAEKVRYLISEGNVKLAEKLIGAQEHSVLCRPTIPTPDNASTTSELLTTAYARVGWECGRANESIALIRKWFAYTRDRKCYRSAVRLGILLSRWHFAADDKLAAKRVLLETLHIAEPGRFLRAFVDEGPIMLDMLRNLAAKGSGAAACSTGYLQLLLESFDDPHARPSASRLPNWSNRYEPLSSREIEILRLTAENMENKEIAEALGLTESTVKWYWKRIFAKLNVHRRFHAVKVARHHGLVA